MFRNKSHSLLTKPRKIVLSATDGTQKEIRLRVKSKSLLLKHLKKSLPNQEYSAECIDTSIEDSEKIIVQACSELCYYSYKNHKYNKWSSKFGTPLYLSKESAVGKIPFYITTSELLKATFVVCRGSYCLDDFLTDILGMATEFHEGKVHQGICQTAEYVYLKCKDTINDLFEKYPEREIIITGHSLGASVAAMVTEFLNYYLPYINVRGICFAPPPTVDQKLWDSMFYRVKTFVIEGDFVPFLSVSNVLKASKSVLPMGINRIFNLFVNQYLKKRSINEIDTTTVLYPPGKCYMFCINDDDSVSLKSITNPNYFSSIVKGLKESNHRFKNYLKVSFQYAGDLLKQ